MIPEHTIEKCYSIQKEIFDSIEIDREHYTFSMEEVSKLDTVHCKYFHKINKNRKNVIVLLHGFFSAGISMFKMVKVLMDYFYVIVIDLPGFGLSSRRKITPNSTDEWIDYFCKCKSLFPNLLCKFENWGFFLNLTVAVY